MTTLIPHCTFRNVSAPTLMIAALLTVFASSNALAQGGGGGGNGGGGGGGGNNNNNNSSGGLSGIEIDAAGVLRVRQFSPQLNQQRIIAAKQQLPADVARRSPLRKVSLRRLEAALAEKLTSGQEPSEDMLALAGLTSVQYVFFYPEQGEIVIAGPAEGYFTDAGGRMRGLDSGQPVVLLEDLVVALRAFPPAQKSNTVISVSIDPTPEGLQRMQQFLRSVRDRARPGDALQIAMGLRNSMGMQTVTFSGVSTATHFAQVLVEADYRMKLIGIGLEQPPVRMLSYVARANPSAVAANAMERWYFVPDYDCVLVSEDELAMQLVGKGVKLIGEGERIGKGGQRQASARGNRASQAFCLEFTEKYPQIAENAAVYAQLKNLCDISVAAAYIQKQDFYGQSGWDMPVFGSEDAFAVETHTAPVQVETAVNAIWKGNTLMTPLGGGVKLQPRVALNTDRMQMDASGQADQTRKAQQIETLKPEQWWWD